MENLEEDLRKAKIRLAEIELEWINFLDKSKRMLGRIVKRAEYVEAHEEPADAPDNGSASIGANTLSARAAEAQRRILARRSRLIGADS